MPTIGILEDRPEFRTSIRRSIRPHLPSDWGIVDVPLLREAKQIPHWLVEHDVQVLIADYKLNERSANTLENPVDYTSDLVIKFIRQAMPDFPVFILTAVPDDADEKPDAASAEAVMKRTEFARDAPVQVKRMIRAAQRFSTQFQRELAELAVLSEEIANGTATEQGRQRAKALQALIGLDITMDSGESRQETLNALSLKLRELEFLKDSLESDLLRGT